MKRTWSKSAQLATLRAAAAASLLSSGLIPRALYAEARGVVVVGNYQATAARYATICACVAGGLSRPGMGSGNFSSRSIHARCSSRTPTLGLPELAKDTDPFPTTPEYTRRCATLLRLELQTFQPPCGVPWSTSCADAGEDARPGPRGRGYSMAQRPRAKCDVSANRRRDAGRR